MTQAMIIEALQNGPLTSQEVCDLTGMPKSSVLSTAKKLRYKGELTTEEVKVGRYRVARYTLEPHMIEAQKVINDEPRCLLNPFDIRNAKGIFSKAEYAVMNSQAKRLLGRPKPAKEITNNQFI
jgi:DNA-binding MarR family transcriptional regulator